MVKESSLAAKAAAGAASGDEVRLHHPNLTHSILEADKYHKEKPSSDSSSPPASPNPPAPNPHSKSSTPPSPPPRRKNSAVATSAQRASRHGPSSCMLNNATFDSFVDVKPLGGPVVDKNSTMEEFAKLIDERADHCGGLVRRLLSIITYVV
ncbi:hypothetical protein HDV00_009246 [Rhizophlyctis rosea]|nr:hypothetical protein HDV00_009246 [Rhizophlyctis rosea]